MTIDIEPAGRGPFNIQWLRDGQPIEGAANSQYTFKANEGVTRLSVRLKNELGETISETVTVVAGRPAKIESVTPDLAEIVVQPARGLALQAKVIEQPGATNTFTWQFAGGSTTTTTPEHTLNDVSFGQAGLTLIAANQWGSDTNTWLIKVDGTPVIKRQPANVAVVAGQAATFSVVADGEPPLTYYWLRGGQLVQRTEKPQVSVLTSVANSSPPAQIQVLVSNRWGFAKSDSAGLTLNLPPRFSKQPANLALREGDGGRLEASAVNGSGYRWYRDGRILRG